MKFEGGGCFVNNSDLKNGCLESWWGKIIISELYGRTYFDEN